MTQHLDSATMPEFFGRRFDSGRLKITASVIIFIFLIPYTASLYNGLSRLFAMAFDIDYAVCVIVMAVLTGVYVIAGGYMATAINDFIQGIIMIFGIIAVILAVLNTQGGLTGALDALARVSDPAVSDTPGVFASFFGPDLPSLMGVVVLTSLGTWGLPQMVQKFYAIKSESAITQGTVISTAFALIVAGGCYFLGGFGRLFSTPEAVAAGGYDSIIPAMLSGLPSILIAVVVILVLSASMSTLSSLVLASSSTLTLDFIKGSLIKEMDERRQVRWMRALVVVFIAISVVLAIIQYRSNLTFIAQLMGVSWGALGLPGPLPLRAVLEAHHQGRLRRMLPLLHRGHAGQHLRRGLVPAGAPVPHQLRRLLYAGGADHRAGGQPVHPRPRPRPGEGDLLLL